VTDNAPATIKLHFEVWRIKTLVDNTIEVTIHLTEDQIPEAAMLMECRRMSITLEATAKAKVIAQKNRMELEDATKKEAAPKVIRMGKRRPQD